MFNNVLPSVINKSKPHAFIVDLPEDAVEARNEFLDLITTKLSKNPSHVCSTADRQLTIDEIVAHLRQKYNLQ